MVLVLAFEPMKTRPDDGKGKCERNLHSAQSLLRAFPTVDDMLSMTPKVRSEKRESCFLMHMSNG